MLRGAYILYPGSADLIYGPAEREDIAALVDVVAPPLPAETFLARIGEFKDIDVIFSGWGGPTLNAALLTALPNLKAVFYGAGSIKSLVTDAFWERNIPITSSYAANAVPVAEYTLAQILFSLKAGWHHLTHAREKRSFDRNRHVIGAYGSTVGLVSLGMIGRRVAQLLKPFEVNLLGFDPLIAPERAGELKVSLTTLDNLFSQSDVVSIHTPWLKETEGLITGRLIASMKPGATLINTSRGAVINEPEMIQALRQRPDVWALLDVTRPEPPATDSPLWTLPNVILTPHIAGSMGAECRRMGRVVVDELRRFVRGEPLQWSISRTQAATMA